jgi:hypothetical protein
MLEFTVVAGTLVASGSGDRRNGDGILLITHQIIRGVISNWLQVPKISESRESEQSINNRQSAYKKWKLQPRSLPNPSLAP